MADAYVDNTNSIGNLTSVTGWTFTNGSATVTCPAAEGDANNEIADGDYVRANGGTQWYKVTARDAGGDEITITPVFQQANVGPVACNYNDADGSAADANAFVHPAQAITDSVRAAGETIYMKGGQTHQMGGIHLQHDEDGAAGNPITVLGDDGTKWAGGDLGHVVFDYNDTAFYVSINADYHWEYENADFIQGANAAGQVYVEDSLNVVFTDCVFRDADVYGIQYIDSHGSMSFCSFYDNNNSSLYLRTSPVALNNCTFNGGAGAGTDRGMFVRGRAQVFEECTFGVTTNHNNTSIQTISAVPEILCRRCLFDAGEPAILLGLTTEDFMYSWGYLRSEDHNQTEGAHEAYYWMGDIVRDTVEADLGGGSSTVIEVTPNANIDTVFPIKCLEWEEQAVAAAQQTRGVAIKIKDPPGGFTYPTGSSSGTLYLRVTYYDHAVNDTVAYAYSTAVLAADDTWVWFPVVFTPAQVQKVRYEVFLGLPQDTAEFYCIDNALYDADPT